MLKNADIVDKGLLALNRLFNAKIGIHEGPGADSMQSCSDGTLIIGKQKVPFFVIPNSTLVRVKYQFSDLLYKYEQKDKKPGRYIFLLDFASDEVAQYLRKNDIFYIDTVGNSFIDLDKFKINIEGRKGDFNQQKERKRAFKKTGLKLIFHLLSSPELLNTSVRNMGAITGISIGTISHVIEDLKEDGFVIQSPNDGRRFSNVKRLINKWSISYAENLRPFVSRGQFISPHNNANRILNEIYENTVSDSVFVGGEFAAKYTHNLLKPSKLVLYTNERLSILAKKYQVFPVSDSQPDSFEILEAFWMKDTNSISTKNKPSRVKGKVNLVDSILIYADLLNSNNYRSYETAEYLLNNDLQNRFQESNLQW